MKFLLTCALAFLSVPLLSAQVLQQPIAGKLAVEEWKQMEIGYDVDQLVTEERFYEPPTSVYAAATRIRTWTNYQGLRARGYITAPETGNYVFWVAAQASGQIWLSSGESKYHKELLCFHGGNSGSGTTGIWPNVNNLWDKYATQMSREVFLEQGQRYYFEALAKEGHNWGSGHISMAWATPSGEREYIPAEVLTSYVLEPEDADDDFLPDAWETLHGLDSSDNGLINRVGDGERGDFDQDGLSNREEYILGLNPASPDTDGDGLLDGAEINIYGTDPSVSDAPDEAAVGTVDLSAYTSEHGLSWNETGQGFIPSEFRGTTTWSFNVPAEGYWLLELETRLLGNLYLNEVVDFNVSIDGAPPVRMSLPYGAIAEGTLRTMPTWLTAGTHTLTLEIDNLFARRTVTIQEIRVLQPVGADLDADGTPDWIVGEFLENNQLTSYSSTSRVSPAFLEGIATYRDQVTLNDVAVLPGVDISHWYANLELNADTPTPFEIALSSQVSESGAILWEPTNVLELESMIVRKGDSLKLAVQSHTGNASEFVLSEQPSWNLTQNGQAVATQSTTAYRARASRAIDGNTSGVWSHSSSSHTWNRNGSWLQVDLGAPYHIESVVLWNNANTNHQSRLSNYRLSVLDANNNVVISKDFHTGTGYTRASETWDLITPVSGQKVRIQKLGLSRANNYWLSLAEMEVIGKSFQFEKSFLTLPARNLTQNGSALASQSTTAYGAVAARAIDGNTSGVWSHNSSSHTSNQSPSWWQVDLGIDAEIESVVIWNNASIGQQNRLSNYRISVLDEVGNVLSFQDFHTDSGHSGLTEKWTLPEAVKGRTVKIEMLGLSRAGQYILTFGEVQVFGRDDSDTLIFDSDASTLVYEFDQAGTQVFHALHESGETSSFTVEVKDIQSFGETRDLLMGFNRTFPLHSDDFDLAFDGGESISHEEIAPGLRLHGLSNGSYNLLARAYEGGPVIASQELNVIGFTDSLQNDNTISFSNSDFPGYDVLIAPITSNGLPPGGTIVIDIFRAGVTFLDGTTTLVLSAEDFENGIYNLEFLFPNGLPGGYCYYVTVYDRNGVSLGTR